MTYVFIDLDGTIANASKRFSAAGPEPVHRGTAAYKKWLKKVQNHKSLAMDKQIPGMRNLAQSLYLGVTTKLYYLTGRSEVYRDVTSEWLRINGFPNAELLMRPIRNQQRNGVLKRGLVEGILKAKQFHVLLVDDDYNGDIETVCHEEGWTFLKAKSGGYWSNEEISTKK